MICLVQNSSSKAEKGEKKGFLCQVRLKKYSIGWWKPGIKKYRKNREVVLVIYVSSPFLKEKRWLKKGDKLLSFFPDCFSSFLQLLLAAACRQRLFNSTRITAVCWLLCDAPRSPKSKRQHPFQHQRCCCGLRLLSHSVGAAGSPSRHSWLIAVGLLEMWREKSRTWTTHFTKGCNFISEIHLAFASLETTTYRLDISTHN